MELAQPREGRADISTTASVGGPSFMTGANNFSLGQMNVHNISHHYGPAEPDGTCTMSIRGGD